MLKAEFTNHELKFIKPSGTSRGLLKHKTSWFLKIWNEENPTKYGLGECSLINGLSIDPPLLIESKLKEVVNKINQFKSIDLTKFPSIQFGLETAHFDLLHGGNKVIFNNDFSSGDRPIYINGLIWMGEKDYMLEQIKSKLDQGFQCLKLKVGSINFEEEKSLIKQIREKFNKDDLELRLDANGAFDYKSAIQNLEELSRYNIHSIEQPIYPGQHSHLKKLCSTSPIPIALDEELIPIKSNKIKEELLEYIRPQYIILKPGLLGGFKKSEYWISIAEKLNIGWWITSALESNIGLNAIAQFSAQFNNDLPQGLGTGKIFSNNIPSFLEQKGEYIKINHSLRWNDSILKFN